MKIINHNFKLPYNPIILELQIYCKKMILNPGCNGIVNLFDLKKRVLQHTSLISLSYSNSDFEHIYYEVCTNLTHQVFKINYHDETFVTIVARKKEFEFAFKDFDACRFN